MRKKEILCVVALSLMLSGCKSEEIVPEVKEPEKTVVVTNAIADPIVAYTDEKVTETTAYHLQTTPVETLDIDIPEFTGIKDPDDMPISETSFVYVEEPEYTFVDIAVENIIWSDAISKENMKIGFCDVNVDGVPEVLVTDLTSEEATIQGSAYTTDLYDLKTMNKLATFKEHSNNTFTKFTSPEERWGFYNYEGYYYFDDACNLVEVCKTIWNEETQLYELFIYGEPVDDETYNEKFPELFDYNTADYDAKVIYCTDNITPDNYNNISGYLSNAIGSWCVAYDIPDVSTILN